MLRPVETFVALRFLREHRDNHFVSFVTVASVIGVGLGVAALIVVLSVMNGFENELRERLLSMAGHASIETDTVLGDEWRAVQADLIEFPGVAGAAPYLELEAMLSSGGTLAGAVISGVDPYLEDSVSGVGQHMREGELTALLPGQRGVVLGRALALRLGVAAGDSITALVPRKRAGASLRTGLREFHVVGVFELGLRDHDNVRALVHLNDAIALTGDAPGLAGLRLRVDNVFKAPEIARDWASSTSLLLNPKVRDWTQDNASYFRAVRIEKLMMTLLLSLIVAVAAFNIVATLVMVVTDKRSGIAILRTLGYSRRSVMIIFGLQGLILGWMGVIIGVFLGVMVALNIQSIAPFLERVFGFEFMPADVYYVVELPADLQISDVSWVAFIALVLTGLATLYPAIRAAGVAPAEVLRYE